MYPTVLTRRPAAARGSGSGSGSAPPVLTARGDRTFRPDIQGLRSVAVLLVVLYHCGVPGLPGGYVGVDVFFVISGFLITRQLITEHESNGRISLSNFYARRIRRLLPAALTVIVVTEVATRSWGPPLQAGPVARDGLFSAFYLMNFRLAAQGIDYQNADAPPSPLQHFWSLAVEEQFYLVWPLAIVLLGFVFRQRIGIALGCLAAAAVLASFALSVGLTHRQATLAYFAPQTRIWELGVGALVAIGVPQLLRLPVVVTRWAGWAGLLLIVLGGVVFTGRTPFPGSAAAMPVAGAALIILAGLGPQTSGVEAALRGRAGQFLGRVSYGWYLWHWPLIVLAPTALHAHFGWPANLAAAAAALGLAVLTNVWIEQVAARGRFGRRRWFGVGAAMSAVVTAACLVIIAAPTAPLSSSGPAGGLTLANGSQLARLLDRAYAAPAVPSNLTPALLDAVDDLPPTSLDGCHAEFLTTVEPPCVFGDPAGSRTVVLFGDSHAEQWFGALDALARARGWKLVSWTKAACPMSDVLLMSSQLQRPFTECPAWHVNTVRMIAALHPDLVIAAGSDALPGPGYPNAAWAASTVHTLTALGDAAKAVVYLADVPAPTTDVPVCLAAHLRDPGRCQFSRRSQTDGLTAGNQFPGRHAAVVAAATAARIPVIDPTDWLCAASGCPIVLRDTLIYRDATHLTQSYSRALEPLMAAALLVAVPQLTGA